MTFSRTFAGASAVIFSVFLTGGGAIALFAFTSHELANLPIHLRLTVTSAIVIGSIAALALMRELWTDLGPVRQVAVGLTTIAGLWLLSVHSDSSLSPIETAGEDVLIGLGIFVFASFLASCFSACNSPVAALREITKPRKAIPLTLIAAILPLTAFELAKHTTFIYYWDYRNYWQKTEELYGLLRSGAWKSTLTIVAAQWSADYSMLPAVPPATLSLVTGYPTRLNYLSSLCILYAAPAYIAVTYLAKRLLDQAPPKNQNQMSAGYGWVFASISVWLGIPFFFNAVLFLMPDIGGCVAVVAAMLSTTTIARLIGDGTLRWNVLNPPAIVVRYSIGLGLSLALVILFRRWYVFIAVGIAASGLALIIHEVWISRRDHVKVRVIITKSLTVLLLVGFATIPLISWVGFNWSQSFGQHAYGRLYAAYNRPLGETASDTAFRLGLLGFVLCAIFVILHRQLRLNAKLLFVVLLSTFISIYLFLRVQTLGPQHLYLLMPLLGSSLAGLSIAAARQWGKSASIGFSALLVAANMASTVKPSSDWLAISAPPYSRWWSPPHQSYAQGFQHIARWLTSEKNQNKTFCVIASSPEINQGVLTEIWQIDSALSESDFRGRLVGLPEVDSRDGPPSIALNRCDLALVGDPFQTHLPSGNQDNVRLVAEDLLDGNGIGAAFDRPPTVFKMSDSVRVLAYQRTRAISNAEYQALVMRFLHLKGPSYTDPSR